MEITTPHGAMEGKTQIQEAFFYNLDMIISVGYRVSSSRATQFRIWQQITDIYAECSIDYDKTAPTTKDFYAMVQNKFHYAIAGKTAAEIVYERAFPNAPSQAPSRQKQRHKRANR